MSDMLSQEAIDALLNGTSAINGDSQAYVPPLTKDEEDALGEIGNICMGTSATTVSTMLDKRVVITTPTVRTYSSAMEMMKDYTRPYLAVQITYTEGLEGNNILLLKEYDALLITNLLLTGEPEVPEDAVLGELEMSCMNEIMNQMVGSSATSMANLLGRAVNISPPVSLLCNVNEDPTVRGFIDDTVPIVRINFDMEIEGVLKSEIMQIIPVDFGKALVASLMHDAEAEKKEAERMAAERSAASKPSAPPPQQAPAQAPAYPQEAPYQQPYQQQPTYNQQPMAMPPQYQQPYQQPMPQQHYQQPAPPPQSVDVRPLQYQAFDAPDFSPPAQYDNMDIVIDVPLQVTVELGKARKNIKDILELGKGSIIVLEKQAGEMVEVQVNGKLIARGEVVVIDDNYGVRITELYSASKRLGL